MKIVFMGTPEFARRVLVSLCDSDHEILAVVTGQDKKAGRSLKLRPTEVKAEAERQGLPVLTPASLKSPELHQQLEELNADLFVVAAFRILPESLYGIPSLGSINIHGSLLPKYRGAAPINWALINGERETGLTSFFLRQRVDTGNIILQEKTSIGPEENFDSLYSRLADMAGPFLLKTLEAIASGRSQPVPQDETSATRAPKITPVDALIDFGMPADKVVDFVRGLSTRPGAYTYFRGKKIKLLACKAEQNSDSGSLRPGTILKHKKRFLVQCGAGAVEILRLTPQGKNEMDGVSFINGFRPQPDEVLGESPPEKAVK